MLFTVTAENAEHLVSFIDDEPMLSVATDLFLLALSFRQFFQMANLPTVKQLQFSLLYLVDFFGPLVYSTLFWSPPTETLS